MTSYLGIYSNRCVSHIGIIRKTVTCSISIKSGKVIGIDEELTPEEKTRILAATKDAPKRGWDIQEGHKFYLCDELRETSFRKSTKYGIWGHRYFDLKKEADWKPTDTLDAIAKKLANRTWE